jgi:hypothetical protein
MKPLPNPLRRNAARNATKFLNVRPSSVMPQVRDGRILLPSIPQVTEIERYPLADYLYDRAKAQSDLALAKLRWVWFKLRLPLDEREQVEKIERVFAKFARPGDNLA